MILQVEQEMQMTNNICLDGYILIFQNIMTLHKVYCGCKF